MAKKNRSKNRENQETAPPGKSQPKTKGQSQLVTYVIIFVFGFLSGIAFTVFKGDSGSGTATVPNQSSSVKDKQSEQAIINLEAEVTSNPRNFQAWVRLGHLYFDTNQPHKAIGAYTKSLELHSGDANLLTDLGIMYRRISDPQKAIESFNKAIEKDPRHMPSRFNKGIVLMYDLNQSSEAIKSWESILAIDPDAKTPNGEPLGDFINRIKSNLTDNQ